MRKYIQILIIPFLLLIFLTTSPKLTYNPKISEVKNSYTEISPQETEEYKLLQTLSIEEKVGQLFLLGIEGTTVSSKTKALIEDKHIGGIIIYSRNIDNNSQLKKLNKDLQSLSEIPLFISIDQEGGIVSRLTDNKTLTKPQYDIKTETEAYNIAYERGLILRDLGFNMNHSPVLEDITDKESFLYDRVFRGNQTEISKLSLSMIDGYTDSGVISTPKHYPGHNNASVDSHKDLPVVNINQKDWNNYISPFTYIIENTYVPAIMVGHVKYPNIDKYPSSISKEIITNRLKSQFKGLVVSDDMQMDALDSYGTPKELAKKALIAGNDLLIYHKDYEQQTEIIDYIISEVEKGNISEEILNEKVLKILNTKQQYLNF